MLNSVTTQNLEYWCNDLSTELVSEALKISAKSNARNFKYTESILRNWEQEGVKTLDDVKALAVKENVIQPSNRNQTQVIQITMILDFRK